MSFNSWRRVTNTKNKFLFNQGAGEKKFKTERVEDLGLNWDMTKFRMYDYALGRFLNVDPLADFTPQESWTPYHYSFNNPIRYNDPYGDMGGNPFGTANPLHAMAQGVQQYLQEAGRQIDNAGGQVKAFFSFGKEVGGSNGPIGGSVSNETRATVIVGTNAQDFFTPTSDNSNASNSSIPFTFKTEIKNETKATIDATTAIEGLDITVKNTTSQDNSTGKVSNSTTITAGKKDNGLFIKTNSGGNTVGGVKAEQKLSTPNGSFIKFGGELSIGN